MNDVKVALGAMGKHIVSFLLFSGRILLAMALGLAILVLAVYIVAHFPWTTLSIVVFGALYFWFNVELIIARTNRECQEYKEKYNVK